MDQFVVFWVVVMLVFLGVELATVGLVSIWFAAGALVSLIIAACGGGVVAQIIAFIAVSVVMMAAVRPFATKYINSKTKPTNVNAVIGQRMILTEEVNNLKRTGKAIVLGNEWSIRAERDDDIIPSGTLVEVLSVSGVKLIVRRVAQ